jgi:hypothetical protein
MTTIETMTTTRTDTKEKTITVTTEQLVDLTTAMAIGLIKAMIETMAEGKTVRDIMYAMAERTMTGDTPAEMTAESGKDQNPN